MGRDTLKHSVKTCARYPKAAAADPFWYCPRCGRVFFKTSKWVKSRRQHKVLWMPTRKYIYEF